MLHRANDSNQQMTLFDETASSWLVENPRYLSEQIITYLGNKRALLSFIGTGVKFVKKELGKDKLDVFDVFSGSGIVARSLKKDARIIYANDIEPYSCIINECYLTDETPELRAALRETCLRLREETAANLAPGFITELYSPADDAHPKSGERVFYTRRNAQYIDTARACIGRLEPGLQKFFLAPLMAEASVHANTSGVFKGFYKDRNGVGCFGGAGKHALQRILGNIELHEPVLSRFSCASEVLQMDALAAAGSVPEVDLAYLDPPYNQHPYGANYFMLNLIVDNQRPLDISKVSGIPTNWNRSPYNKPQLAREALFAVIENIKAKYVLVSYNSEGFIQYDELESFMARLGRLWIFEQQYNTFRGSRNLRGRDIHVQEYLFLVKKG